MSDKEPLSILLDDDAPTDIAISNPQIIKIDNLETDQVLKQVEDIQSLLKSVMVEGEHYGFIPGVKKKILMKPGAEKIGLTFRLLPKYEIERIDHKDFHREYIVTCSLYHVSGNFVGQGVGSCSTLESKYRYRNEYEKKGRVTKEYWDDRDSDKWKGMQTKKFDDGWYFVVKGERIENPDIPDQYNTILKMAKKRAHVDSILTATAASDIFTQDLDEKGTGGKKENKSYYQNPKGNRVPKMTVIEAKDDIRKMLDNDTNGIFTKTEKDDMLDRIDKDKPYRGGWIAVREKMKLKLEKETVSF